MDAGQLWAGGVATAVVAALIAIVGILICRWLLKVPILAPQRAGAWGSASTGWYALSAAAVAIAATALMYLLAVSTPRPTSFFSWIIGLATVIAVVFPFSTTAPLSQKVATAIVNLVLGFAIGSLISGVAWRAMRRPSYGPGDYPPGYPPREVRTTRVQQRDVWRSLSLRPGLAALGRLEATAGRCPSGAATAAAARFRSHRPGFVS